MSVGAARKRVYSRSSDILGSRLGIRNRNAPTSKSGGQATCSAPRKSGHPAVAVGFDLYCKLLKRAVESLEGNEAGGGTATLRFELPEDRRGGSSLRPVVSPGPSVPDRLHFRHPPPHRAPTAGWPKASSQEGLRCAPVRMEGPVRHAAAGC